LQTEGLQFPIISKFYRLLSSVPPHRKVIIAASKKLSSTLDVLFIKIEKVCQQ